MVLFFVYLFSIFFRIFDYDLKSTFMNKLLFKPPTRKQMKFDLALSFTALALSIIALVVNIIKLLN